MNFLKALSICVLAFLSACAAPPNSAKVDVAPKATVTFIDVANFDAELASSLNAPLDSVEVLFYKKISPNKMPERLQKWISAIERSGGSVKINTPPNEPTPRSPLAHAVNGTALLSYGQTFVLNGLVEREKDEIRSGVPVLQYFFNKSSKLDYNRQILTLVTATFPHFQLDWALESAADLTGF